MLPDTSPLASGPADPASRSSICEYAWLGRVDYDAARILQARIAGERANGERPDTLLLLEHPPVYTTGRRDATRNLRRPPELLGAPLVETDRGGDITFHGPGQLVAYPIMDLRAARLGVVDYVRGLEDVIIRTLGVYGIDGTTECGLTGVWVENQKVAAIGVRVSRPGGAAGGWITSHGLALNVSVDLDWFDRIIPCGITDRGVTSIERLRGHAPGIGEVSAQLAAEFGAVFGRSMLPAPDRALPSIASAPA